MPLSYLLHGLSKALREHLFSEGRTQTQEANEQTPAPRQGWREIGAVHQAFQLACASQEDEEDSFPCDYIQLDFPWRMYNTVSNCK